MFVTILSYVPANYKEIDLFIICLFGKHVFSLSLLEMISGRFALVDRLSVIIVIIIL